MRKHPDTMVHASDAVGAWNGRPSFTNEDYLGGVLKIVEMSCRRL